MTALNEFPPMFALTEASKFATAAAQAGETVAELTTTGAEAVEDLQSQKKRAESIYSEFKNVLNNITTGVNTGVGNMIKIAQKNVDEYGQNVVKEGIKNVPEVPKIPETVLQTGGASLKKYQKEAKMIGGRIQQSQLSFLSPYVNRARILKQYGGKWHTKRRHQLKRKLTSRSYK